MKNKIYVFTKYDDQGASSRLRFLQYILKMNDGETEFVVCPLFDNKYINKINNNIRVSKVYIIYRYFKRLMKLCSISRNDILWVEKEFLPYCPSLVECILSKLNVKYIVDYDDAIFHNYDTHRIWFIRKLLRNKIDKVMKYAHHVVVGNSYLANRTLLNNKKCTVIPTVVEPNRYQVNQHNNTKLVIGWIGSPSTQKYLIEIKDVLHCICNDFGAELLFVGASKDILNEFNSSFVTVVPWSEENESYYINKMSIGIMPLNDGMWERGKCGYKLIQYMASSIPVVGSDVGVNKFIIEKSNAGYVVKNKEEWLNAFYELLSNKQYRVKLGGNGRESVINIFSVDSQIEQLYSILRN